MPSGTPLDLFTTALKSALASFTFIPKSSE